MFSYTGDAYPFDFVQEAYAAGYFVGFSDGTFRPYARLTRVQLVRVLVRAAGTTLAEPPAGYDAGFTDVSPADIAVVAKAKFNGLIDGKTADHFRPLRHRHARSHGQDPLQRALDVS